MILDKLDNLITYKDINSYFEVIVNILKDIDFQKLKVGKYYVNKSLFYIVSEYFTHDYSSDLWEKHEIYNDLQIVVSGCEKIGISNESGNHTKSYNRDEDISFHNAEATSMYTLCTSSFIYVPLGELHQPGLHCDYNEKVKKIVFKFTD